MPHTPGPWELADENNGHFEISIGETICSLDRSSRYSDKYVIDRSEMIANGHLIMASPDMLEAIQYYFDVLKEVRGESWDKNPDHVLAKMITAHKKATE